jgi:hypothetical protein
MKTAAGTFDRVAQGNEDYNHGPGWQAVSVVFAVVFSGAIFFGLAKTQRTTPAPVAPMLEDLRAVMISPPPPALESAGSSGPAENAPVAVEVAVGAAESPHPDVVHVAIAPLREIAQPPAKLETQLTLGAFKPKSGTGGVGLAERRIYDSAEVDRIVVPLRQVSPRITSEMVRGKTQHSVVLLFVVGTDGYASDIRVMQSVSPLVDKLVIDAINEWTFRPAQKNRRAVPQWVQLPVVVVTENTGSPFSK